jgi:dTDP-4-dehydrorhamnose reductase
MRILVTGTSGQVGGALRPLLDVAHEVVAPGRPDFDLSRPETLAAALDDLSPELIINPAAYTAVDRAEDERDLAFLVNATAPDVMARWASAREIPLIHFSTDYVFDGKGDRPWREDSPTAPLSIYGASKLAGENAIRGAAGPHLIVRTSWVYAGRGTNFLVTIARLARERGELRVVVDQVGSPTSARTIAAAVAALPMENLADLPRHFARAGGIVNVAASGETSWHGFANAIVGGLRSRGVALAVHSILPLRTDEYPTKAKRPHNSRFDLTRLRGAFGLVTPSWQEALEPELDELALQMR